MNWAWWDFVIVGLSVAQIAGLVGVVLAILKIKNGPVKTIQGRIANLTAKGQTLAETGKGISTKTVPHVLGVGLAFQGIAKAIKPLPTTGMLFTYGTLQGAFAQVQMVRGGLKAFSNWRTRKKNVEAYRAGKEKQRRRAASLLERMGLVPPIARYLPDAVQVYRIARQTLQSVRSKQ
jgi:hypothetical protein